MQTHFPASDIDANGSKAYWAINPTGKALVFVHGFWGSAMGSWAQFPLLLMREPSCSGWDLIFYGYDGKYTRATNSAYNLEKFLDTLCTDPLQLIDPPIRAVSGRPMSFYYSNVTIVAHSLGAIVSRQAVLNAHLRQKSWTSRIGLVLFAPAHQGANIIALFSDAITGMRLRILGIIKFLLKYRYRVLQDLEPGCGTLRKLLEDTLQAMTAAGAKYLVARVVVHSDADNVVEPIRFALDPPHELIHRKTHRQVCKPQLYFMEPVKWVLGA